MKSEVRHLYRKLIWIGREYPLGKEYFNQRLKAAFLENSLLNDPVDIQKKIAHGEYVYKELEALWFLKKYRAMKRMYPQ